MASPRSTRRAIARVQPLMARDPEGNLVSPKLRADQQEVDSLYKQLPTHAEEGKQELDRLFASGHERRDAGQTAEARERFVAAYLLARELTFGGGEAEALTLAATCTLELGELPLGVEQMEGSRKLHAKLGNADGEAEAQCNLGLAHAALGDLQRAQHAYRQSLRLARHQPLRLTTLGHLGTLLLRRGRTAEAQQVLSQALALALALGDVASEVRVLQRLAATYCRPPQARRGAGEAAEAEAAAEVAEAAEEAVERGAADAEKVPTEAEVLADEVRQLHGKIPQDSVRGLEEAVAEVAAAEARAAVVAAAEAAAAVVAAAEAAEAAEAEQAVEAEVEVEVEVHDGRGEGGAWGEQDDALNASAALRCLQRAEWLAGQAVEDGSAESSLLMQVLRQRRAQHLLMDDADMARECEQRIDALVKDSVD